MKKFIKLTCVVLTLMVLGFGCRPESVSPNANTAKQPATKGAYDCDHAEIDPICGNAKVFQLISEDGSLTVNRCFAGPSQGFQSIPCSNLMPNWGTVTMVNGTDLVGATYELPVGWFVQMQFDYFGPVSTFSFDALGKPVVGANWSTAVANPLMNDWRCTRNLNTLGSTFAMATKLVVVKVSLTGQVVPNSATTLWLFDSNAPIGTSPYTAVWSRNACPVLTAVPHSAIL